MAVAEQRPVRVESRVDNLAKETGELRGACVHLAAKEDLTRAALKTVLWVVGIGLPGWVTLVKASCAAADDERPRLLTEQLAAVASTRLPSLSKPSACLPASQILPPLPCPPAPVRGHCPQSKQQPRRRQHRRSFRRPSTPVSRPATALLPAPLRSKRCCRSSCPPRPPRTKGVRSSPRTPQSTKN